MSAVHRTLPHSLEPEKGFLSSALLNPAALAGDMARTIRPADFYLAAHAEVFGVVNDAWRENRPLDLITLTVALRDAGRLDAVGGPGFVTELFAFVPTAANAEFYAETVSEKAKLRAIIGRCRSAAERAYADGAAAEDILAAELAPLMDDLTASAGRPAPTMADLESEAIERYERAATGQRLDHEWVVPTGFERLDSLLDGGLRFGQLAVVAAETSRGKSALALNLAENMAVRANTPTPALFFSYEMSGAEMTDRLNASLADVPMGALRRGRLSQDQLVRLSEATRRAALSPLVLRDDCSAWTAGDLCAQVRAAAIRHGVKLVALDYVQLVPPSPHAARNERRDQQIAEVTRRLKGLALELNLAVVVLSQLNDEGRLRESRTIGHDADLVLKIEWGKDAADRPDPENVSLHVEKNRNGARGTVPLRFNGPLCRFEPRPD